MTDKQLTEVIEGNKLIAIFMGCKQKTYWVCGEETKGFGFDNTHITEYWRESGFLHITPYHTSWNWLMPVVEKISKMHLLNWDNTPCTDIIDTCYPTTFNMPDEEGNVMFRFKGFSLHTSKTLIGAAWKAVVEVSEYHLNQNKQS